MAGFNIKLVMGTRSLLTLSLVGNADIVFDMSKAINKGELSKADNSFNVLVRILEYAKVSAEYHILMGELHDNIISMSDIDISNALSKIIGLLPIEKIEEFLSMENYKSPINLMEVFNEDIIRNKEGSREQTFTRQDYRDLVKMSILLKMIVPILSRYIYIYDIDMSSSGSIKVYRLVDRIDAIRTLPAYEKMAAFVSKNIGGDDSITELDVSRILNKNITRTKFDQFIITSIIMFLGVVGTPDADTVQHSMVSDMSRLCKNKTALSKNVMLNNTNISSDEDDSNAATTDTYTSVSEIPIGYVEEYIYSYGPIPASPWNNYTAISSLDNIRSQISIPIDDKYIQEALAIKDTLINRKLDRSQRAIICWLGFSVIESKYLSYLEKEITVNFRILTYAMLKTHGINSIANIMLSTIYDDGIFISKVNTQKASDELEEVLTNMYKKLSVNKKSKTRGLGLFGLDSIESEDNSFKELIVRPVAKRFSSVRWLSHLISGDDGIFVITNAREEIIKTLALSYNDINPMNYYSSDIL